MEQPFGTFKNNTVLERFRKMRLCYLTPLPLHPKMMTSFGTFPKDALLLPYSPSPTTAPQTDTRYLINRTSERFGKITLLLPYSSPLHCTPKVTLATSKIEHPNVCKDTLSFPYTLPPPRCTPKWPSLSHKLIIWTFRKDTLSLSYSPPPTAPQEWHSLSHISNIVNPILHGKTIRNLHE